MYSTRVFARRGAIRALSTLSAPQKQKIFLSSPQFAVVGATPNPNKWGWKFLQLFKSAQLPVTAVNPKHKTVGGAACVASVEDLPSPQSTSILVVTPPSSTLEVLRRANEAKTPMIWIQPGAADSTVKGFIEANNIEDKVVLDGPELLSAPALALVNFTTPFASAPATITPSTSPREARGPMGDMSSPKRPSPPHSRSPRNGGDQNTASSPGTVQPDSSPQSLPSSAGPGSQTSSAQPKPDGGPCGSVLMLNAVISQRANATTGTNISSAIKSGAQGVTSSGDIGTRSTQINLRTFGSKNTRKARNRRGAPNDVSPAGSFTVDKEFPGMA